MSVAPDDLAAPLVGNELEGQVPLSRTSTNPMQKSGATQGPLTIPDSFIWFLSKLYIKFEDFTDENKYPSESETVQYMPYMRNTSKEWIIDIHGANHIRECAKKGQFWASLGILRLLSIYILFPIWVNRSFADCDKPAETKDIGLASAVGNDTWMFLTFIFFYFPLFFVLQTKCLQAVLGTHLRSVTREGTETQSETDGSGTSKCQKAVPEIIGSNYPPLQMLINFVWVKCLRQPLTNTSTFVLWFLSVSTIPFFARHMAFMWNAEVLGMILKTDSGIQQSPLKYIFNDCPGQYPTGLQYVWAKTMESSTPYKAFCWLLHWDPGHAQFANFVALTYGIVFLEFVFALAATLRVRQINICGFEQLPTHGGGRKNATLRFKTLYDVSGTNDLSVLMHQADIACFDAVTDLQTKWELGRLSNFKACMKAKNIQFSDLNREEQIDYLYSFLTQVQRMIAKFALAGLAQNVVTANVQISFLALLINGMGYDKFWKSMVMVFVNVLMCLVGTILAAFDLLALWDCHTQFKTEDINIGSVHGGHATRLYDRIRKILYRRLPVYVFLYGVLTIWNLIKFGAIFCCETHLWNFPRCVEPKDLE